MGYSLFEQNLRNVKIHSVTGSCIVELKEKMKHFRGFLPKLQFFKNILYV